jgi:hypothetical protein
MTEEGRKEISLNELAKHVQQKGPNVNLNDIQVKGVITIKDKDGNVKNTMDIVSLEEE